MKHEKELLELFDRLEELKPHAWLELAYTRPTDWMVHIWDKTGGVGEKLVEVQETTRKSACKKACKKLNKLLSVLEGE